MPVPLIIPIAAAAVGGLVVGALVRQPEINRLKEQVRTLQKEIVRLQSVLKEQQRQINEFKIRLQTLKAHSFVERQRLQGITRGFLYLQYGFKEYVELTLQQARGRELPESELAFYNIFNALMSEQEVGDEQKLLVARYVKDRYGYQIDHLIPMGDDEQVALVKMVEAAE